MTSLVRAHSSEIDTCIFPENKVYFFKQDFIGQNRRLRDPLTNYVICCGFPKSPTLFDCVYNSDRDFTLIRSLVFLAFCFRVFPSTKRSASWLLEPAIRQGFSQFEQD